MTECEVELIKSMDMQSFFGQSWTSGEGLNPTCHFQLTRFLADAIESMPFVMASLLYLLLHGHIKLSYCLDYNKLIMFIMT